MTRFLLEIAAAVTIAVALLAWFADFLQPGIWAGRAERTPGVEQVPA